MQGTYLMTRQQWQLAGEVLHLSVMDEEERVVGGEKNVSTAVALHGGDDFLCYAFHLGFSLLPSRDAVEARTASHPEATVFVLSGAPGAHDIRCQRVEPLPLWVVGEYSLPVANDEAS